MGFFLSVIFDIGIKIEENKNWVLLVPVSAIRILRDLDDRRVSMGNNWECDPLRSTSGGSVIFALKIRNHTNIFYFWKTRNNQFLLKRKFG